MRKVLFALVSIATMAMASCFEGTGYNQTSEFYQYAVIDTTSTPVKLKLYYTGQVLKDFTNLKYPEQLAQFNLEDAQLANVYLRQQIDASYRQTLTVLGGKKLDVQPVTNQLPIDSLMPILAWMQIHIHNNYTPAVWVNEGYLNVCPVIPSGKSGKFHLMPEGASNDTLYFNLTASYQEDSLKQYGDCLFFDLRTLRDTTNADSDLLPKMREVLATMQQHRTDSMTIVLTSKFIDYNFDYKGNDTIRTMRSSSNYFHYDF